MTKYIYLHQKPRAISFTQLPNFLFELPGYRLLGNEAKILYAMVLRRAGLSAKMVGLTNTTEFISTIPSMR